MKKLLILAITAIAFASCTENQRAKNFGGTVNVNLEPNRKLVTVTWKDDQIWYLTRPMDSSEKAETYNFQEESSWGVIEGTVVIIESKK
jgi:hypothetical protein